MNNIPTTIFAGFLTLIATVTSARAQITFTNVADSSSLTYSAFSIPSINTAGTLGFHANFDAGGSGLFTSDGTTTTTIADSSSPIYFSFGSLSPSINTAGTLGFFANLDAGGSGLFTSDGTTTTTIALTSGPTYTGFGTVPPSN